MRQPTPGDNAKIAVLKARIRQLEALLSLYEPTTTLRPWPKGPQRVLSPDTVQKAVDRLLVHCPENGIKPSVPEAFACAVIPEACTCQELLMALADACHSAEPRPARKRFVNYFQHVQQELVCQGITPEELVALKDFGLLAKDNVTGYWEGRTGKGRFWTLRQAIQHVKETNEIAVYVTLDLQNLGGLNDFLNHTKANEVYSEIAAAVHKELSAVASDSTFFRHGGDETSAFLIDTTERAVLAALALAKDDVLHLAKKHGLDGIPHPKHQGDGRMSGIGIHYGICQMQPEHEDDPTVVFRAAEADLERRKKSAV
jgi:GGDEF domain-containing protein